MTLDSAAQLLASALMLLQAVSANPSLPQESRDTALTVAEKAITEATRTIGRRPGAGAPSCRIVSDKFNYIAGEVVVFDYSGTNAVALEFVPVHSEYDALPVAEGTLLGMHGQYRKAVTKTGYPFIVLKATAQDGRSATCSGMVHVY